ncbi:MAG: N-6 DNA methylase [Bacilli bacterium]
MAIIDEKVLWASADKLRGSIGASDYMHIVLGLIFLKYVSDRFEEKYQELVADGDGFENDKDEYTSEHIFWVPDKARWDYVSTFSKQEIIGQKLDEAFIEIEKENDELKGILPKIYSSSTVDKRRLGELIDLFTNQLETDGEGDFMGQVYEYFMNKFARSLGQTGGEFYTPRCIVKLLVKMLNPTVGRVYDPCCGSGGMFVQAADFVKAHQGNVDNISVFGQELNATTWKLAKMNLAIRGIDANLGDAPGDTFHDDKHKALRVDYILANPPFNISDYGQPSLLEDPRWIYGIPPVGNANYAWIEHMYSKLAPKGIAGFVLANGSLSTSAKQEYDIRKAMLEEGVIDCIITLPDKLFYTTGIPVCLWFVRKNKSNKNVLFIDARNLGEMIDRKVRELKEEDLVLISETYHNWLNNNNYDDKKGFCKSASLEEIREADYTLVSGRYVGIDDSDKMSEEEIDAEIKKLSAELLDLFEENKQLEQKVIDILKSNLD